MENMEHMINSNFWAGKRVFITGHTGFKGSWLTLVLESLGAEIYGYSLKPSTNPSLFELCDIDKTIITEYGDIRNKEALQKAISSFNPDIIFHLAAQPLVRYSYKEPLETYEVNVMGTANLLDSVRTLTEKDSKKRAIINITTDKVYENKEWHWGYRENEPLGGYDPYSSSKACSELVTSSYRSSYFNPTHYNQHNVAIATARAGNVIGGGDFSQDRLIPDCLKSILCGERILIRNPHSIRPWQHVLEPIKGYLMLAQKLFENGQFFSEAWNFGPDDTDAKPVEWIVESLCRKWGHHASYELDAGLHPHEATYLKLDCSKAKARLGWYPKWKIDDALNAIIEWTYSFKNNYSIREITTKQIKEYFELK